MEKETKLLFAITSLCLLAACTKSDDILTKDSHDANLKCAPFNNGHVFVVRPNGTDDTYNITQAFANAKNAGRGSIVKLVEGNYHLGFIEIREFFGSIIGAGKEKTIITNLSELLPEGLIEKNKVPALITFIGGDVSVSDLSIMLSEGLIWLGSNEMNLLLFSDFSADFSPAVKHIKADLNNIKLIDPLVPNVVSEPYCSFNGVKFASDVLQVTGNKLLPRSNIDIIISNSEFTNLWRGVCVIGCKSGNFDFGKNGCNIFTGNVQGLVINENIGVRVKIMNNEFTVPDGNFSGLDINTAENHTYEYVRTGNMTYYICNNIFNINSLQGIFILDMWRYEHPDNPAWMQIMCENNTFYILKDWIAIALAFALKDAVFLRNNIVGGDFNSYMQNSGLYWIPPDDPNSPMAVSENCKFLNNRFMSNAILYMGWNTQNYLIIGDLNKVLLIDEGVNNKVVGLTNPHHMDAKIEKDINDRMRKIGDKYNHQRSASYKYATPCQ